MLVKAQLQMIKNLVEDQRKFYEDSQIKLSNAQLTEKFNQSFYMGVVAGMLFEEDRDNELSFFNEKLELLAKRVQIMVENGFENALIRNCIE